MLMDSRTLSTKWELKHFLRSTDKLLGCKGHPPIVQNSHRALDRINCSFGLENHHPLVLRVSFGRAVFWEALHSKCATRLELPAVGMIAALLLEATRPRTREINNKGF
eukprot:1173722-Amphidinium_carterae.1